MATAMNLDFTLKIWSSVCKIFSDSKRLIHPHYISSILLCVSFLFLRITPPICYLVFRDGRCDLDWREYEILTFLAVIVMFRNRKASGWLQYVSTFLMYGKIASSIMFFRLSLAMGIIHLVLCIIHLIILPAPSYSGPENIVYFRGPHLGNELERDKRITWLIEFYAPWSPSCVDFSETFATLSGKYGGLTNFKFGKLDASRYPKEAEKYNVNASALSRQLPTLILFQNGKEIARRPGWDARGKIIKFSFSEDNIISALDLNNVYLQCKNNPLKSKNKIEKNAENCENKKEN